MPMCDVIAEVQSNFIEIALRYGCSPINLLHIFRTSFLKNTSGWLLMVILVCKKHVLFYVNISSIISLEILNKDIDNYWKNVNLILSLEEHHIWYQKLDCIHYLSLFSVYSLKSGYKQAQVLQNQIDIHLVLVSIYQI